MIHKKSNNIDVKKINKNILYKYILKNGKVSKHDISIDLNMSMPTILQNIKELFDDDLIKEVGEFESSGGRKAKAISINENAKYSLGIDITNNHISLVLVNLLGNIVNSVRLKKHFNFSEKYLLWFKDSINEFINDFEFERILGAGVSIPGIIDKSGQYITSSYVLGINNIECSSFSNFIPFNSIFINDANAAGFAEAKYIDNNAVYLSLSDSVGGAIILSDNIYMGDNVRAGEFGHVTIVPDGKKCYCGKIGCFDSYCNASLLSDLTDGKLNLFFERLDNGEFLDVWKNYLNYLAIMVNNLRMSFDCDIIIGGYVGSYFQKYIDDLKKLVSKLNTFENNADYIKVCRHNFEASAIGASLKHIYDFIDGI